MNHDLLNAEQRPDDHTLTPPRGVDGGGDPEQDTRHTAMSGGVAAHKIQ